MSAASDPSVVIEVLVATGFLTGVSEAARWFFGRNRAKVDSASVVQGMAIDLLTPLHEELKRANDKVDALTTKLDIVLADLDHERSDKAEIAAWALAAKALLDANEVRYPAVPAVLVRAA